MRSPRRRGLTIDAFSLSQIAGRIGKDQINKMINDSHDNRRLAAGSSARSLQLSAAAAAAKADFFFFFQGLCAEILL